MSEFFEKRALDYSQRSQRGLWRRVRAREYAAVVKLLEPRRGLRLLDLGCGAGHYSLALQHEFGVDVVAVDSSPGMLSRLADAPVTTWLGDAQALPDLGRFDRVLAAGLFEFIAQPETVLQRSVRLMTTAARLVLLVPNDGVSGRMYKAVHEWQGCPVFLRSTEDYVRLARGFGLSLCGWQPCTPISQVLAFELPSQ